MVAHLAERLHTLLIRVEMQFPGGHDEMKGKFA